MLVCIPSQATDVDIANRQRRGIVTSTVTGLVVITVMSSDENGVVNVGQSNVLELDAANRTLSAGPGLDTDTILTVNTSTVLDSNGLDNISFTTLTERTNTETMAIGTGDIGNGDIGDIYTNM